ncbi:Uncharacterised protein [Mycobacterium tuberculosis]|nr:Uncharacterised protein [Mycobacterium tuberculosis]
MVVVCAGADVLTVSVKALEAAPWLPAASATTAL